MENGPAVGRPAVGAACAIFDDRGRVLFEPDAHDGPMLHFVFAIRVPNRHEPAPSSPEISETRYSPIGELPIPISDVTERRIRDVAACGPAGLVTIGLRQWRT